MAETFPGSDLTMEQLLCALNRKLDGQVDYRSIRETLDPQKISNLENSALQALSSIRYLKNAHSPVNLLHPELLFLVFGTLMSNNIYWVVVNRVCRYWHITALSFPSLWSIMDLDYDEVTMDQALMLLEHAKHSILSVTLNIGWYPESFIQVVASHMSHMRKLYIQLWNWRASLLSYFIRGNAPMLRDLSIIISPEYIGGSYVDPRFPPLLLEVNAPILQRLHLSGFLPGQHTHNLTELSLGDIAPELSPSPSMTRLLDLLESHVNLHHIALPTFRHGLEDGDPGRIVHLNNLEVLEMYGVMVQILNHLSLPVTTDIIFYDEVQLYTMERFLPASLVHFPVVKEVEVVMIERFRKVTAHRHGKTGSINISNGLVWIPSSLHPLPIANLRELWLIEPKTNNPITKTYECLQSILLSLRALDTLILISCETECHDILQMLRPGEEDILCPSLTSITVYSDYRPDFTELFDLAAARESKGVPFRKISLHSNKSWLHEEVANMRKRVEVVEVGGDAPKWPYQDSAKLLKLGDVRKR